MAIECNQEQEVRPTEFLKAENITVEAKLVAYHAAGATFLPEIPAFGTASSVAYNTNGGGAGLVANFRDALVTTLTLPSASLRRLCRTAKRNLPA